ncbi:MAG: Lrp/AsnC family transcriptional regulator [Paracoccaceae bacterium]
MTLLTPLDLKVLDEFQRDLPLVSRPFAAMAEKIGVTEDVLLADLGRLQGRGHDGLRRRDLPAEYGGRLDAGCDRRAGLAGRGSGADRWR